MSYTVGLDFGTHQTKICVEDATNPAQKIYEFYEFEDLDGNSSVLLPSIVQINNDNTVSYGFVDNNKCKTIPQSTPKPQLELPKEPILKLPTKPQKIKKQSDWKENLLRLKNKLFNIKTEYDRQLEKWRLECVETTNEYNLKLEQHKKETKKLTKAYEIALAKWKSENLSKEHIFRYFKLATFSPQDRQYKISPEIISVWYLTFVLFKLQKKYGNDFFTQMGVPYSINEEDSEKQKNIAYKILITANLLVSKYGNIDNFLNTKYTDLLKDTELSNYTKQDIVDYGINVVPEAFAGLSSITQQGKLGGGMHLLADIGGGTTDIAFFTITEKLPNIHAVISFPQGLNYIFEEYLQTNNLLSMSDVQQLFRNNQKDFESSVLYYHRRLIDNTNKMIRRVEQEFLSKKTGFNVSRLRDALKDKPIVYCGGGSMYDLMRIKLSYFTDIRLIDKSLLGIPYVKNKNIDVSLFTILATSYGLSIQLENDIKMTPIENVFSHLKREEIEKKNDYEHGLTDT